MQRFTAKLTPEADGWFSVECVEIPGVITQGKDKAEAMRNFREALELWLEEFGKPAPLPVVESGEVSA
jgi:predicted RNase H-like HicB family nuclease